MRLWIGLYLPQLPLEIFRPRWCEPQAHIVLAHEQVLALTAEARKMGVRVGMRKGGVMAIAPHAVLHQRDPAMEEAVRNDVALALLQYTPEVALAEDNSLLLDVTASLRAFNGHRALARRVRATVMDLGFTVRLGMAPTAQGAWLLAKYPRALRLKCRRVIRIAHLARLLDQLPCNLLPAAHAYFDWLEGIGCVTLADMRQLPRAGLARRTGKQVIEALDRAYGAAPELFDWVQAPPQFSARLELPERIEHAEGMLFAARRLLLQMVGWLAARHLAVTRIIFFLEHERGRTAVPPTTIEIVLAEAAWQEEHLLRLLKERLARIEMAAAVIALRLEVAQLCALAPPSASLFPEPGGTKADYHRLLELLTARLGGECVLAPAPAADYRPEVSNCWLPAAQVDAMAFKPLPAERPFWLLEKPIALLLREHRPFYGSPLKLVKGPERIECGWWDSGFAVRDYFIAQGADSACYWIYQERNESEARWFLHGLFA